MKTIQLTIVGLLFSLFSYGQTDTIIRMINGKNFNVYNKESTSIISSTDYYNEGSYENFTINIDSSQVLLLHLYDNCKYCKDTIITRNIEYLGRITNTIHSENVKSSSNVYYVDGTYIKRVIIRKPEISIN